MDNKCINLKDLKTYEINYKIKIINRTNWSIN